jgi:hypothetical protein
LDIRRLYPLHFEKDSSGGASGDLTRMLAEKATESRGSARHSQIRFLVRQNLRREAILPGFDLLTKSLAHQRRSDGSAIE